MGRRGGGGVAYPLTAGTLFASLLLSESLVFMPST